MDNERKTVMKLMGAWRKRYGVMPERSLMRMEATGHYTLMLLNMVVAQQWRAWLAHPNDILQSMGIKRVKNDKVDALRIAQYARTFHEKARLFTAQNLKLDRLKHLITRRKHLVRSRARHRTHITDLNRYMDRQVRIEFDRMDERQIKLEDKLVAHVDDLILMRSRLTRRPSGSTICCAPYPALASAGRISGGLHRWLRALQHAAPTLPAMPAWRPSSAAQAAAYADEHKCRIKLINRSRPYFTCPLW
ncbi:MAG: transposase [Flavobacteriales bacterium]|nr:transposase [Flavobacteriales bacterium]